MNPFALFLIAVAALAALLIVLCLSIWYYWRAKDLAPFLSKLKSVKEEIALAQDSAARENQRVKDLQNERALAERTIADGEAARKWLEENRGKVEALQADVSKLSADAKKAEEIYNERQTELTERQQQIATIASQCAQEEAKLAGQKASLESLRSDQTRLESRVSDLEKQKAGLGNEIGDLDAKKQSAERLLEDLRRKIAEVREEKQRLDGLVAAGEAKIAQQGKEVSTLLGQADAAQRILSNLSETRKEDDDKWKNLDLPVVGPSNRSFGQIDQSAWLREFETSLTRHGFVFDPRAIRAFHTGLLCGQVSPLVVLAGISGTGKSLLPELYASALGMNFLSVPVQPRWDSPQDLFGFYNYMEGRYKATELARLLWQFDAYNNDAAKRLSTLPVSLVLLDEMNLARVEYYFSDLLSKLETRNGIDPENPEQRSRAEIELECNASGQIGLVRRLFVSRHVLFVGTMNEDESTQTLSDKVIDRSNVLRFGRPASLEANPRKGDFLDEWASKPRIDAETWDSWSGGVESRTGANNRGVEFLSAVMGPVSDALDGIGRPYGYRVDSAMKSYVANYPGTKEDAVADQIEMKILPKLNGLELDMDGFDRAKAVLLEAIEKTHDRKLRAAFEKSCPRGATFFKWQGVAR